MLSKRYESTEVDRRTGRQWEDLVSKGDDFLKTFSVFRSKLYRKASFQPKFWPKYTDHG